MSISIHSCCYKSCRYQVTSEIIKVCFAVVVPGHALDIHTFEGILADVKKKELSKYKN